MRILGTVRSRRLSSLLSSSFDDLPTHASQFDYNKLTSTPNRTVATGAILATVHNGSDPTRKHR